MAARPPVSLVMTFSLCPRSMSTLILGAPKSTPTAARWLTSSMTAATCSNALAGGILSSANWHTASVPVVDALVDQVTAIRFSRGLLLLPRTEQQGDDVRVRDLAHVREEIIHLVVPVVVE